jgi:hypothetical protein
MDKELVELAKEDEETKRVIIERLQDLEKMNLATKANYSGKLIVSEELLRGAVQMATKTIVGLSIENELKDEKIEELEKEVTDVVKTRINENSNIKRKNYENDPQKNTRVLKELKRFNNLSKQITG